MGGPAHAFDSFPQSMALARCSLWSFQCGSASRLLRTGRRQSVRLRRTWDMRGAGSVRLPPRVLRARLLLWAPGSSGAVSLQRPESRCLRDLRQQMRPLGR